MNKSKPSIILTVIIIVIAIIAVFAITSKNTTSNKPENPTIGISTSQITQTENYSKPETTTSETSKDENLTQENKYRIVGYTIKASADGQYDAANPQLSTITLSPLDDESTTYDVILAENFPSRVIDCAKSIIIKCNLNLAGQARGRDVFSMKNWSVINALTGEDIGQPSDTELSQIK